MAIPHMGAPAPRGVEQLGRGNRDIIEIFPSDDASCGYIAERDLP